MSEIDTALLPDFLTAAREHLDEIEAMLIKLSQESESEEIIRDLFKPVHTIKGSAQFIGLSQIELLSHTMEDLLDKLRRQEIQITTAMVDVLMDSRDRIMFLIGELEQSQQEHTSVNDLVDKINGLMSSDDSGDNLSVGDDEENDQELYQIFIDNLQQRILGIKGLLADSERSENKMSCLTGCNEALDNMISSANYMGYGDLVDQFKVWKKEAAAAISRADDEDPLDLGFMDSRLEWIIGLYPQIGAAILMMEDGSPDEDMTAEVMAAFDTAGDMEDVMGEVPTPKSEPVDTPPIQEDDPVLAEEDEEDIDIEYELVGDFITEAVEHLEEVETLLLDLSNDSMNTDLMNDVFRPIHTIKGGAQFIGLSRIAKLSHRMEDLLDLMRRGERESTSAAIDTLIDGRDRIGKLIKELETSQREESPVRDLVARLTVLIDDGQSADTPVEEPESREDVSEPAETLPVTSLQETAAQDLITLGGDDFHEDEDDQELFGIFLDQLREKFKALNAKITDLTIVSEPAPVLQQCLDDVLALKSSANYMGYEELTGFYERWLEAISAAQEQLSSGTSPTLDFMSGYVQEVANLFPQIGDAIVDKSIPNSEYRQPQGESIPGTQPEPVSSDAEEEEALFERLSNALDSAMNQDPASESVETLHDVFEQMLSGKEVDTRAAIDAVKQDILAEKGEPRKADPEPVKEVDTVERRLDDRRGEKDDRRSEDRRSGERIYKKSIRVDADKIDSLMNQVGELVVDRSFFFQLFNEMRKLQDFLKESADLDQREVKQMRAFSYRLGEAIAKFGRTTNELQEGVMKVRMLPISQLFNRYPRLLRDLTHNTDKNVKLEVFGEDTELDKMIVEELADPLIHIIRNAVDHGMETAQERIKAGKPETGTLTLEASQEGNHIVIDVSDDGRGIDPEKVKAKAIANGIRTQEDIDNMSDEDVIGLIMTAGFSTAEKITGTSGRGVGMDVVKNNIEKLNGTLEIDSSPGEGTLMRIKIPLTLAIIPALMIRVGKSMFTIPLANVEETLHIDLSETTLIEGTEVIYLRGHTLPIFYLSRLFNLESVATEDNKAFVVVISTGGQQVGFAVDELMGQEEVVIKPLVDYLQEKSGFSGATIIGDGRISLILDVYALVKMTAQRQAQRQQQLAARRRSLNADNLIETNTTLQ